MEIVGAIVGGLTYAGFVLVVYALYTLPALIVMAGIWKATQLFGSTIISRTIFILAAIITLSPSLELGGLMVLVAPNWLTFARSIRDNTWIWYQQNWWWYVTSAVITGVLANKIYSVGISKSPMRTIIGQ
jgi:hypothetical protein